MQKPSEQCLAHSKVPSVTCNYLIVGSEGSSGS